MSLLEIIRETAMLFARSQGWRSFDHQIELDLQLPWTFRDQLKNDFAQQASMFISTDTVKGTDQEIRDMLTDVEQPLRFTQLRLPENILINLLDSNDGFGFTLTKKVSPDPAQQAIPFPAGEVRAAPYTSD